MRTKELMAGLSLISVLNSCAQEPPERSALPPAQEFLAERPLPETESVTTPMFEAKTEEELQSQIITALTNNEVFKIDPDSVYLRWMGLNDTGAADDIGSVIRIDRPFQFEAEVAGWAGTIAGGIFQDALTCQIILSLYAIEEREVDNFWLSGQAEEVNSKLLLSNQSETAAFATPGGTLVGQMSELPNLISRADFAAADKLELIADETVPLAPNC